MYQRRDFFKKARKFICRVGVTAKSTHVVVLIVILSICMVVSSEVGRNRMHACFRGHLTESPKSPTGELARLRSLCSAHLVEYHTLERYVPGSVPGRTNIQDLAIAEENVLPLL